MRPSPRPDPDDASDGPRPEVSVLVVSYNTRAMTLACLASVAAQTRAAHEVIVLDNASTDGSAGAVAQAHPGVRLIASADNLGFAGGNNRAAAQARGEYLLLLNPDTEVRDGAIDRLLDFARSRPRAGIWGGRTLFADGSLNPTSVHRRMSLWTLLCRATGLTGLFPASALFNAEAYGGWKRDTVRRVDIVSGAFFLIRREMWEALGGLDETFFMYGEEADLCLRATARFGAAPVVTPEATIIHHGGASERVRADKLVRLLSAKATLIARHFPAWQRGAGLALLAAWPASRALATGLRGRLPGGGGAAEAARVWAEVWRRRAEWRRGYPASG